VAFYDAISRYTMDEDNIHASRESLTNRNYIVYVVKDGDTLEDLARRRLGTQKRFWEIADLNPNVKFPLDIKVGDVLRLPS